MDPFRLLDELRTLGQNGLQYADNPDDRERYDRILALVSEYYGESLDVPASEVRARFSDELGHVTPKVGAEAGVFDAEGDALLVRRANNDAWCLPCGWVEPTESPAETAVRETREETGLDVRPVELVGVYSLPVGGKFGPHGQIALLYLCEATGGTLATSHETEAVGYRTVKHVSNWQNYHQIFALDAKERWRAPLA